MDPELDKRLKSIEDQLEDNTRVLKRIRRVQRNSNLFRVFYWFIIIGITLGAFYYVKPFIEKAKDIYTGYNDLMNVSSGDVNQLQNLWNQINNKK